MKIAITGHRPDKLGGYGDNNPVEHWVKEHLRVVFDHFRPEYIWSGMALGTDQWAAEVAVDRGYPFKAAVPFKGQESRWPLDSRLHYGRLLEAAQEVVIVTEGDYAVWKMQRRNEYMVDRADLVVAVWDGSDGGTANCVKYALDQGKQVVVIDPKEYKNG